MANKRMYFDKTEVTLIYPSGNKVVTRNLNREQIQRIQFSKCKEFSLFRFVDSEKVTITNSQTAAPLVYTKQKNKKFFQEYKEGLIEFAKANNVTMQDDTAGQE